MSLEEVTKEVWQETHFQTIKELHEQMITLGDQYLDMLEVYRDYHSALKTHHLKYFIDYDKNIMTFEKSVERHVGFKTNYKKGGKK